MNTTSIQTTVFFPNRYASNKHIKMVGTILERKHESPCYLTFSFIHKQFLRTPQSRLDMFIATTQAENFLVTSHCVHLTQCTPENKHLVTYLLEKVLEIKPFKNFESFEQGRLQNLVSWRDGSEVKNAGYSCRRPRFSSQHPQGSSQPSTTPVSEDLMTSLGLHQKFMHTVQKHTCSKTGIHLKYKYISQLS